MLAAHGRPLSYELTGSFATHDDGFETPSAAARDRALHRRHVDRGRRAQRRARQGAHAQGRHHPASIAGGRRLRSSTARAPTGTSRSARYEIAVTGTEFDVRWSDEPRALRGGDEVGQHRRARLADGRRHPAARRPAAGGVAGEEDAGRQRGRVRAARDRAAARAGRRAPRRAPRDDTAREEPPSAPDAQRAVVPPPPAPEPPRGAGAVCRCRPPPFEPAPLPPPQQQPPSPVPETPARRRLPTSDQGGASCNARPLPQIRFEHAGEGFRVLSRRARQPCSATRSSTTALVVRRRLAALRCFVRHHRVARPGRGVVPVGRGGRSSCPATSICAAAR